MSTLHIVSSSPFTSDALDLALGFASENDAILLIENGVYGASNSTDNVQRLTSVPSGLCYFVLQEDLFARALFEPLQDFKAVSYVDFVELVCQHNNSISWS